MLTYLVDRTVPPTFAHDDPAVLARHSRRAADAYRQVGACWLGGVITEDRMYSLVTAERRDDLLAYGRLLGIPADDMVLRQVIRPLGPFLAEARG
jgi:hypothetical protein